MVKAIRWTITKKVGGTVFVLLAVILALLINSILALSKIDSELKEVAHIDVPLTEYANEIEIAQLEQRILMDEVIRKRLSGDLIADNEKTEISTWGIKIYQQFDLAIAVAQKGIDTTANIEFTHILATLSQLKTQHEQIDELLAQVLKPDASKQQINDIILLDEAFDRLAIELIHAIEKLTQRNAQLVLKHEEQFALISYSLGGIGGVIGIVLALLIITSIKLSIGKLSHNIDLVSAAIESNKDIPIQDVEHIKSSDEFSDLSKNLTNMIARVSDDIDKREQMSEQLSELATKDHLTKCFNRFKWEQVSQLELERSSRSGSPLSLIYFDIDHFKRINDTFGHDIGDVTLVNVAQIALQKCRHIDSVYRLGGEEFAVLLPDTDIVEAEAIAERLRIEIADYAFEKVQQVTISLGVTQLNPENDSAESFVKRADEALYSSKQNGRNKVSIKT